MGFMQYHGRAVHFEDRILTHVQIVIVQKLMKHESLLVSWKDGANVGDGRASMWVAPSTPIYFKFDSSRTPDISSEWLLSLGKSANSSEGLIITNEDGSFALSERNGHPGVLGEKTAS